MSYRTLIEINHDCAFVIEENTFEFVETLGRYLASGGPQTAEALEVYGVRVIGMRHHSGKFIVEGEPDGFPVQHLPAPHQGGR